MGCLLASYHQSGLCVSVVRVAALESPIHPRFRPAIATFADEMHVVALQGYECVFENHTSGGNLEPCLFKHSMPSNVSPEILHSQMYFCEHVAKLAHGLWSCVLHLCYMLGGIHGWLQASGDGRGPGQWGSQRGFLDNEHAIWMGDLNYRVTIPDEQVLPSCCLPVCIYGPS